MHFLITPALLLALVGYGSAAPSIVKRVNCGNPTADIAGTDVVIGYRTAVSLEAQELNEHGTFIDDGNFNFNGQTGTGKYMSPSPGEWDVGSNNCYCIVWADGTKYGDAGKVWIPEDEWWPSSESAMQSYISGLNLNGISAPISLRFSNVQGHGSDLQSMVPTALFEQYADDNSIGIKTKCYDSVSAVQGVTNAQPNYNDPSIQNRGGPAPPPSPSPAPPPAPSPAPPAPPAPPTPPRA